MKVQISNPLFFRLVKVEDQHFETENYTFRGLYAIEVENKHLLLKKRIKYPSLLVEKNGKELDCPLVDELGESINVITVPPRKKVVLKVRIEQKNPPFTDIGHFSYYLSYCLDHSMKPHKAHLEKIASSEVSG